MKFTFEAWTNIMIMAEDARNLDDLKRVILLMLAKAEIGDQYGLSEED
jgi:hypothetical protein